MNYNSYNDFWMQRMSWTAKENVTEFTKKCGMNIRVVRGCR